MSPGGVGGTPWAGAGVCHPLWASGGGPWAPDLRSFDPQRALTWASSALHMSCSLSGVMSTGTSNGEPSSCPPSSWNCTSSRCTSRAAASSCANKRSGRQPRAWEGRVPTPACLPPSLIADLGHQRPVARPRPHPRTPTATAAAIPRPHVEEKDAGETERRPVVGWCRSSRHRPLVFRRGSVTPRQAWHP